VSHSVSAVRSLCDRVMVMEAGRVVATGDVDSMTSRYLEITARSRPKQIEGAHVLFSVSNATEDESDFTLTKFETLDSAGIPKPIVSTWDAVVFRIHFYSRRDFNAGAVEFQIRSLDGDKVLRFSTRPDSNLAVNFEAGHQSIDCFVNELQLASGSYIVAGGLTVPEVRYLCWSDEIGILEVHPKDVYGSGLPPSVERALVASRHTWKLKSPQLSTFSQILEDTHD
jgi:lipopolysaccharide transport system ATP-binding protein